VLFLLIDIVLLLCSENALVASAAAGSFLVFVGRGSPHRIGTLNQRSLFARRLTLRLLRTPLSGFTLTAVQKQNNDNLLILSAKAGPETDPPRRSSARGRNGHRCSVGYRFRRGTSTVTARCYCRQQKAVEALLPKPRRPGLRVPRRVSTANAANGNLRSSLGNFNRIVSDRRIGHRRRRSFFLPFLVFRGTINAGIAAAARRATPFDA